MAIPEPNADFLDGKTPTIEWAGKKWPIPLLAPKQNRHVIPALMRSMKVVAGMSPEKLKSGSLDVTEAQMDDLYDIVYWGLKRAHPTLTRDDFDDVDLPMMEMMKMIPVVALASRGPTKPGEEANSGTEGEANRQTGT